MPLGLKGKEDTFLFLHGLETGLQWMSQECISSSSDEKCLKTLLNLGFTGKTKVLQKTSTSSRKPEKQASKLTFSAKSNAPI